ncbi:MAG TPA: FHA domain-containing serine/threonine-protein kinase, partial [Planctomycetota bacterium]|nr:FHA domain-containing serine/threonine-protein kinase [Planctomycetota bacterium]
MRFYLRLLGPKSYRLQVPPGRVLAIGRAPDADLRIDDSRVSRRHCEVEVRDDRLILRDLGSRNGTVLGTEKFTGEVVGVPGARLKIGSAFVLIESDEGEGAGPGPGETDAGLGSAPAAGDPGLPRIPGFEVLGEIGGQRAGRLLRARPAGGGDEVAVKIVEPGAADRDHVVARFQREARALQRLNHPNIVGIREVNQAGSLLYYVAEYVPGEALAQRLARGPLPLREALGMAIQIAKALALAHREGVVHRDVSPASIVTTAAGIAKLSDFAFVKSGEGGGSLTGLGEMIGDLRYCSPEQASDPRHVDHRTDLYGLGATLFHAIAGRPPFVAKGQLELLRLTIGVPAPRLRELVPEAPAAVEAIVGKLLAKAPPER